VLDRLFNLTMKSISMADFNTI